MKKLKVMVSVTLAIMIISGLVGDLNPVYAQANTEYVTLNTQGSGTNLREVVKMIARQAGVNILLDKNVTGKVSLALKDVYFEKALELISKTNGLTIRKEGNTYIVGRAKDLAEGFDRGLTRTFRLNFAKPETVQKVVGDVFKTTTGIPLKVSVDNRINAIVVQGTKDQLDQVEGLVKDLDVKVHQVLIEAKLVEVKTDGETKLGFDWGWTTGQSKDGHVIPDGGHGGHGSIFSVSEYQSKLAQATSYNPAIGAENGANDLFKFGDFFRGKFLFEATFDALEKTGNSKVLSNPKIATLNGQKAFIEIGSKIVYNTGGDQGAAEKDVGIKLEITPQINDEGWITTEIHPSVTFLEKYESGLPIIGRRIASTTVRVKDGEEILIGGLIKEETTKSTSKFPILGNIPLLKSFFTNKDNTNASQQLIILVKPSIVPEVES